MSAESEISRREYARLRQAEIDHPATEHTWAGGWCLHCGGGNDALGLRHLPNCPRPQQPTPPV